MPVHPQLPTPGGAPLPGSGRDLTGPGLPGRASGWPEASVAGVLCNTQTPCKIHAGFYCRANFSCQPVSRLCGSFPELSRRPPRTQGLGVIFMHLKSDGNRLALVERTGPRAGGVATAAVGAAG